MQANTKRVLIKIFKIAGWITLSVILLLVAVILLIQIPAVQLKVTQKAISFLEKKIGTEVDLKSIHIAFPKAIVLEGIYLEDQKGDTLLYAEKFSVDTDLWALTKNEIQLNDIRLENAIANIDRAENDSAFNFTYILDAFAGDSTAVPDTLEQKKWDFSLETLTLENIRLNFQDLLEGNIANLSLGTFELTMEEFDLYNNRFAIGDVTLANTSGNLKQSRVPIPNSSEVLDTALTATDVPDISLQTFTLKNINLQYEQSAVGQLMRLDLGEANIDAERIDLVNQVIDINEFNLKQSFVAYHQRQGIEASDPAVSDQNGSVNPGSSKPWTVSVKEVDLANNSLQYYDFTKGQTHGAIDFDHLWITHLNLDVQDILYNGSDMHANLRNLSFQEKSGFNLRSFTTEVTMTETSAAVKGLLLLTGNSRLQMQARAGFESLKDLANNYANATLTVDINESFVNVRDILYFNPTALDSLPIELPRTANLRIDAGLNGAMKDLDIDHLEFSALADTYLKTSGTISGLPDTRSMIMNIALDKFYTTKADMESILPDTLLPDSIALPGWINIEGGMQGTTKKASFNTLLTSDVGAIDVKGKMNLDSTSALRGFDVHAGLTMVDIGKILMKPDSVMGTTSLTLYAHTDGLSPREMSGTLAGEVHHLEYNGYRYENLKINGDVRDQVFALESSLNDKNLDFTFSGDYNYAEEIPKYNLTFDLRNADFEALNLSQRQLKARGTLLVNMATSDFKVLNGNLGVRKVAIFDGDDLYAVDSLLFVSIDQEGRSEIDIDSDLLKARFEGSINIFGLPGVVREYFNTYYSLHDSLEVKDAGRQHFSFDIELKNTDLLTGILVPQLISFVPGKITGAFDSDDQQLDLRVEINEIRYANIGVKSFRFRTTSDASALNYNIMVDKIMVDSMLVDGLEFNGTVANDSLETELIILDSVDVQKYVLAGTFFSRATEGLFELRLLPDRIKLNYQPWQVPASNFFRFGGEKLVAHNVQLVNGREKITIESKAEPGTPIAIGFRELNLEYLSSMIAQEKPLSGLLDGDINLFPDSSGMNFTADMNIANFRISDVPWGDIALNVEQTTKNRFDVDFAISGNKNDVTIRGYYLGGEAAAMDLVANINNFNLESVRPLVEGQLNDLSGALTGRMTLQGSPQNPDVDGRIQVKNTSFLSTYLNSTYAIDNESIIFNNDGIEFDQFQITDNEKNEARLDGKILTKTYRDFEFDLNLVTNNFRLINTTEKDNELFYGKVDIEANARIRGSMTTPIVDMNISLTEGSDLTYVVPQAQASVLEAEGIVKFVDKTFEGDPFMDRVSREVADTIKSTFRGVDLTAKIELSDQESFTIIIDPITQDQLSIKGNTTLTLNVDPTGDILLSGRYEISEGTYQLSFYKFVKREFAIEKGSSITWSGDPLNAQMDIRAIYNVETAPIELFSNQLTGADQTEVNQYKQRLPFLVYLNISGELLHPDIAFKLEMPVEERNAFGGNVYARLQDINTRESDLNKQVFALLILKRFIADNPFENQAAAGIEGTARSSVSKILSEQLNRLSENVKGVELSFDIKSYEDYSSGQGEGQTELQLGFSKTLLNDRLVVKLAGNIDIEGQNANRSATDYIGDIALEYKLTPDGRFRITGFRNSNYDMIDGELIETGAGLIYVKDYNTLSELFKSNAKTKN